MTPQTFSLEMCRLLSSLAPGFEGHWKWIKYKDGVYGHYQSPKIYCGKVLNKNWEIICPAWQVEDVLRNLDKLNGEFCKVYPSEIAEKIAKCFFFYSTDTAYQKIEEYLWEILGHSRTEECTGAHCKCMQNDCANHHYNDHKK